MTSPQTVSRPNNSTTVRSASLALRVLGAASPDAAAVIADRMFATPRRFPRPAVEHGLVENGWPLEIPFRGRTLSAWEWGEAGPRVLLVHGWEGRAAQLGAMVAPLAERGFRVVGVDLPAHGESPGTTTSFTEIAAAVEATVDALGGPVHAIVAHSMGGAVTSWAARERALAKRYVMISPPRRLADFAGTVATHLGLDPATRAAFEARVGRRLGVPLASVTVEGNVEHQRAPLLVLHDEEDREVPIGAGETVARCWPGAHLHRTRGLGHRRILRDPAGVEAVLRFVAWGRLPA
jgi:pimeloyl-ACP methyl ester carboxylesterase